jgi:hypothetical protein
VAASNFQPRPFIFVPQRDGTEKAAFVASAVKVAPTEPAYIFYNQSSGFDLMGNSLGGRLAADNRLPLLFEVSGGYFCQNFSASCSAFM